MLHIHHHDSFSILDGVGSPMHCARIAAQLGHPALCQSNHGSLNGALAHRKACQEFGLIPIIGIEAYFRPNRHVREKEWRYRKWHLILIAKNLAGWHNLIRLSSVAYADGLYQFPCIDWDLMERHSEGIICTTSCVLGPLSYLIQNGTDDVIADWVKRSLKIYGDDLFFSLMPHDFDLQRTHNVAVASLANQYSVPLVHEKDSHYPEPGWVETQKISILTGMNKTFAQAEEENRKRIQAGDEVYELWHPDLHLSSEAEDRAMYAAHHPDLPQSAVDEAIANTDLILRRVEPYLPDSTLKMPRLKGIDPKAQVMAWCREGLREMGKEGDPVYEERLRYEASVIDQRDAWNYFYLVADVVRWARSDAPLPADADDPNPQPKRPIRINSGRGSAAASLVCRTSKITMVDPIAHKFKFERFLNPERKSMPDIDLDIASSTRPLIKEYVARKYGREAVADIAAYQHFQPRAALKAVAKCIYGFDSEAFKIIARITHEDTGCIDPVHDTDLIKIRERESELDQWATSFPEAWEHARRLENAGDPSVMRLSKHAGAVAITPGRVTDFMPTIKADETDGMFRTAWAETTRISVVDEIGIVKVDFLALKGMDQQQMILDMIEEHTGERIDLDDLPALRDPYAVELEVMQHVFCEANTLGVNQLQSDGIRDFIRRAQPQNLVDLAAINALYRPGPLGSGGHNRYVKRKSGVEQVALPEVLDPILGDTYSSVAFQEQIMELFEVLVGYTPGQADDIRKIIAKLYRDKGGLAEQKLAEHKDSFLKGATAAIGQESAESLWQEVLPFTAYSFNRAHAGSYMVQSYQDGWLKEHYPLFFYTALHTMEEKKSALILREARAFKVPVLPPDINISGNGFTPDVQNDAIRYGLSGIKGIGDAAAAQVIADRPFTSLEDFTTRSSRKYSKVNKKSRDILARTGALDCFGVRDDWTPQERALAELDFLGVALEPGGTLGDDAEIVKANVYTEQELAALNQNDQATVAGKVIEVRKFKIKTGRNVGQEGANIKLALDLDHYSLTCWPETWSRFQLLIESGDLLMVLGKLDAGGKVIVRDVMPLAEFVVEQRAEQEVVAA